MHRPSLFLPFLFLIAFWSLSFAAAGGGGGNLASPGPVFESDGVELYRIDSSDPNIRVVTDFDYLHPLQVSADKSSFLRGGSADSLSGNAVLCPGADLTVSTPISGKWAAPSFYARVPYWYVECKEQLPAQSLQRDAPIHWNSQGYDSLINRQLCGPGLSCWGQEGPMTSEPVDYDIGIDNQGNPLPLLPGKLASVASVCKGTNTISLSRNGVPLGAIQTDTTNAGQTSFSRMYPDLSVGNYQVLTDFSVDGCLVVSRTPACEGVETEHVFGRASLSPLNNPSATYGETFPTQTLNFQVQDVQAAGSVSGTLPSPSDTLCMKADNQMLIKTTFTNTGSVPVHVSSNIIADNGFQASPCMLCGNNGGFGISIPPGQSQDLFLTLTSPQGFNAATDVLIRFLFEAEAPTCGDSLGAFTIQYHVDPNCPVPSRCELTPNTASITRGTAQHFDLACFQNANPVACTNSIWSLQGLNGRFVDDQSNTGTDLTMQSSGGQGQVVVDTNSGQCVADVTALPAPVDRCELDPAAATIARGSSQYFSLSCFRNNIPVPCLNPAWVLQGLNGRFANDQSDTGTDLTMLSNGGQGQVQVSTATGPCAASVTAVPAKQLNRCDITPNPATVPENTPQEFFIRCFQNNLPVACTNTQWSVQGLANDIVDAKDVSVDVRIRSAGQGTLTALTDIATCQAAIDAPPQPPSRCQISPDILTAPSGTTQPLALQCFRNSAAVPCAMASWNLLAAPGLFQLKNPSVTGVDVGFLQEGDGTVRASTDAGVCQGLLNSEIPPKSDRCELAPGTATVQPGGVQHFDLTCFQNNVQQPFCNDARWLLQGLNGQVESAVSGTGSDVKITSESGQGQVQVTTSVGQCTAAIAVEAVPPNRCELAPSPVIIRQDSTQHFAISCFQNNAAVACPKVGWSFTGLPVQFTADDAGADVTMQAPNGNGFLIANTALGDCNATVFAAASLNGCMISPDSVQVLHNGLQEFFLSCSQNGNPVACLNTFWSADANLAAAFLFRSSNHSVVFFGSENETGRVQASTGQGFNCFSTVTTLPHKNESIPKFVPPPDPEDGPTNQTCQLSSTLAIFGPGQVRSFGFTCPLAPAQRCTGDITKVIQNPDLARIIPTPPGKSGIWVNGTAEGKTFLIVNVDDRINGKNEHFACHAQLFIEKFTCDQVV